MERMSNSWEIGRVKPYMEYLDLNLERRLYNMVHFVDELDKGLGKDDWDKEGGELDKDFWVT